MNENPFNRYEPPRKTRTQFKNPTEEAKARRADPSEFPRMVYRHRTVKDADGNERDELLDLTVMDPVDLKDALKDGWSQTP